jgi:trimeric autotransporter adhesin
LTPSLAGTYTIEVGVFSSTGQQWSWNAAAGTIAVNSALSFTSSATAPSSVAPGGSAPISVSVTETGAGSLTNGNVELQIFNSSGTAVATQAWSGQNFTAGQNHPYSYTWTPAASLPAGTYTIDVGVFDSTWAHNYYWNTDATIAVTSSGAPAVSLSNTSLSFANQKVGTTSTAKSVTLTNSGTGALSISSVTVTGSNPGDFAQTNNCGTSVAAGAKCTFSVTFKPAASGNRSASVSIADNATGSPQSIKLTGKGK